MKADLVGSEATDRLLLRRLIHRSLEGSSPKDGALNHEGRLMNLDLPDEGTWSQRVRRDVSNKRKATDEGLNNIDVSPTDELKTVL